MKKERKIIGWREIVDFPNFGIKKIKAKVDTGARTSSLHAYNIKVRKTSRGEYVDFEVHPEQRNTKKTIKCSSKILEYRKIKSSNGQSELRPVVLAELKLLGEIFTIELTLTNRDEMGFRLLLGRESFRKNFLVDAGNSFYGEKEKKKKK